jgi:hypothetical protein
MTVNYNGSYCLGTVSGTETLRRPTATPPAQPEAPAEPEPPAPPAPPPPPPAVESAKCNSSKGSDIAECIEQRYPEYGRKGVSLSQRKANMQFLRDRLIEHATCKGLRVGHNLRRGGPEISNDFITFHTGGRWVGVDIASGYDDPKTTLNMMWYQHGSSSNWGHPYYKDYGPVNCP